MSVSSDEYRWHPPIRCKMTPSGSLVPMRRWTERVAQDLQNALAPRCSFVVTAIDRERGTITVVSE